MKDETKPEREIGRWEKAALYVAFTIAEAPLLFLIIYATAITYGVVSAEGSTSMRERGII